MTALLSAEVAARGGAAAGAGALYTVTLGEGPVGLAIALDDVGGVLVSKLTSASDGTPLAAKASGAIAVGDEVLAVNGQPVGALPSLPRIAALFTSAPRPLTLLLARPPATSVEV